MGMTLTGKVQPYKAGFGAMMPDVFHLPFPNDLHGVTQDDALPGVYIVTANGQPLTGDWTEVLTTPLEPGAFITVMESWQTPAGTALGGLDNAYFDWQYLR